MILQSSNGSKTARSRLLDTDEGLIALRNVIDNAAS